MAEDSISPDKTQLFKKSDADSSMHPPYLIVVDGPRRGARFSLQDGSNIIGRLEESHVIFDDQSVSRRHSDLQWGAQAWTLQDLGSKNGTYVNGSLITEPVVVGHKDFIRVGIYTLRLILEPMASEEEMTIPDDMLEAGTVFAHTDNIQAGTERKKDGETLRLEGEQAPATGAGREITAPHSPLEEEEELSDSVPVRPSSPKARIWILGSALFGAVLAAALYFYWDTILKPKEDEVELLKKPKVAAQVPPPQAIPLGPPEPIKPATVPIFVDCVANPFPATVVFDGKEIGKTPLKINLDLEPNKSYQIDGQFKMEEMQETYTDHLQFSVTAEQSTVPLLFRAPVGTIKIVNLPRDSSMYLEGYFDYNKFQGKPVKLQNLVLNKPIYAPYGRYILELRQPKPVGTPGNFVEDIIYRREFILKQEQPAFVVDISEDNLKQLPTEIHSTPSGAVVYIDQQKVGETPFLGNVLLGKHILTLRKEGFFEYTQEFETSINTPFKAEVPLRTSVAGDKMNQAKVLIAKEIYPDALQLLSDAFNATPSEKETAEIRYLLGNVYLRMQDIPKAISYFEQSKAHPDFQYWSELGLASSYATQGNMQKGLVPLVDVLLNAKDPEITKEAGLLLRQISPLRSVVYIQTDPPGADVYLNDQKVSQPTPVLLHELGLGAYRLKFEKTGFQPVSVDLNLKVSDFNPVFAKLKPVKQ